MGTVWVSKTTMVFGGKPDNLFHYLSLWIIYSMTIIAYSRKEGAMMSDSAVSDEEYLLTRPEPKIWVVGGWLVGAAKSSYPINVFLEWFRDNLEDEQLSESLEFMEDDFEALVVDPDGEVYLYNMYLCPSSLGQVDYYATGSASKIAFPLLDLGHTLDEVIDQCCKWDTFCKSPSQRIEFD